MEKAATSDDLLLLLHSLPGLYAGDQLRPFGYLMRNLFSRGPKQQTPFGLIRLNHTKSAEDVKEKVR